MREPPRDRRNRRRPSYGFLSMMKDVLLVAVFLALLVMNYLNINILHLLEQQDAAYDAENNSMTISPPNRKTNAKVPTKTTETKATRQSKENKKSFREVLWDKKVSIDRQNKNITTKPKQTLRSTKKTGVRQHKIPGSDKSHIVEENPAAEHEPKYGSTNDNKTYAGAGMRNPNATALLIQKFDSIYKGANVFSKFDSAPIVDEEHNLIFFTVPKVACTTFKFLFRRIAGVEDWDFQDGADAKNLPHNPRFNNLKYLYHYSLEEASTMMTDPSWTKAIFVRDPKTRFLSAFLDKAVGNYGSFIANFCCTEAKKCTEEKFDRRTSVLKAIKQCQVPAWDSRRKELTATWLDDQTCCSELHQCQQTTMNVEVSLLFPRTISHSVCGILQHLSSRVLVTGVFGNNSHLPKWSLG